jgi:hypothetical protein
MKTQLFRSLTIASSFLFASAAFSQDVTPDASNSNILPSLQSIGSGCAEDSGASAHWEGATLVVNFSEMVAEKGQGISLTQSRKTCSLTLDLKLPKGLSYALAAYTAVGYDDLADKDTRNFTITNFFQGDGETASSSSESTGPLSKSFRTRHWNSSSELLWSPCGESRAQTITAALRVANGGDRASESVAGLDSLRLTFRVRQCAAVLR